MNLVTVATRIVARAKADSGSGGLFDTGGALVSGIYTILAPPSAPYPYIVVTFPDGQNEEAMGVENWHLSPRFSVYAQVDRDGAAETFVSMLSKITDRIIGDWSLHSSGLPSFGFHRWSMSMASSPPASGDYTGTPFRVVRASADAIDEHTARMDLEFETYFSRRQAT